ncbi:hypothetical protein NKH77_20150 [Streptomyces sp. M19]
MPYEGGAHELIVFDDEHTCHGRHRTPYEGGNMSGMRRGLVHTTAWLLATGAAVAMSWYGCAPC